MVFYISYVILSSLGYRDSCECRRLSAQGLYPETYCTSYMWSTGCWISFHSLSALTSGGREIELKSPHSHKSPSPIYHKWQLLRALQTLQWNEPDTWIRLGKNLALQGHLSNTPWHCHPWKEKLGGDWDTRKLREQVAKDPA